MPKLTQRGLEAVTTAQAGTIVREEGNLFGRVRSTAAGGVSISFYYRFRFDGKLKDMSCGTWPADSLASIRGTRDAARDKVAKGINPAVQKKITRHELQEEAAQKLAAIEAARVTDLTIKDMFDAWTTDGVRRKDGNAMLLRMFNADVLPPIGTVAIKDVTEHHLRAVLRAMVDRGVNRSAVMMHANLVQMFGWARKRQPWRKLMVEGDPMDLIEIDRIVSPEYDMDNQCDRVLSPTEIVDLRNNLARQQAEYDAAPNKRIVPQPVERRTQLGIWIMLSTMCRVGEMSMARWDHVDLAAGEWFIPKANVKDNIADLTVYLSEFALQQFKQLHALTGDTEWCFPNRDATDHINLRAISKQVGDRQTTFKTNADGTPRAPMKNRRADDTLVLLGGEGGAWTPHDLRRTGATMMQKLGVALDVIDRCQNHVLPGSKVRRHYLHHDYAEEKRGAWSALGAQITILLKPEKPNKQTDDDSL
jgi:integrase